MGIIARVGTRLAGRFTSAGLEAREALPVSRDFFGATPSQLAQGNGSVFSPPPRSRSAATMQLGGIGVVARLRSCRKVSGRGAVGWKSYPGMSGNQEGPAKLARIF